MSKPARLLDLGTKEYAEVWALQRELVAARQKDEIPDTLVFVEHPHVITAGRSAHKENLLATSDAWAEPGSVGRSPSREGAGTLSGFPREIGGIPLFEIERGGDVTYHGPGQLVGYPIFLLRQEERDLHVYLRNLEESVIRAIARFGVVGERKPGWTGVWTAGGARKLTSIGVAVKKWVTMHGFALNVSTDLARFGAINPCGLDAAVMGSLSGELGRPVEMAPVKAAVRDAFAEVFERTFG
ncbi:MAG TPA: lipoyl(octanoyl) transferase LipB [Polyangia bacterium]|nr:lipoyl(octanoyl) transferase LipB [Polyangia bacterium]